MDRLFPLQTADDSSKMKMSLEEETIYKLLSLEPVSIDELIMKAGILPQKVMAALMYLEIKGLAKQLPGKLYIRTGRELF